MQLLHLCCQRAENVGVGCGSWINACLDTSLDQWARLLQGSTISATLIHKFCWPKDTLITTCVSGDVSFGFLWTDFQTVFPVVFRCLPYLNLPYYLQWFLNAQQILTSWSSCPDHVTSISSCLNCWLVSAEVNAWLAREENQVASGLGTTEDFQIGLHSPDLNTTSTSWSQMSQLLCPLCCLIKNISINQHHGSSCCICIICV